jgi:hypothetical protein
MSMGRSRLLRGGRSSSNAEWLALGVLGVAVGQQRSGLAREDRSDSTVALDLVSQTLASPTLATFLT